MLRGAGGSMLRGPGACMLRRSFDDKLPVNDLKRQQWHCLFVHIHAEALKRNRVFENEKLTRKEGKTGRQNIIHHTNRVG